VVVIIVGRGWIMSKKADFHGFCEHLKTLEKEGTPISVVELARLAIQYNTPMPSRNVKTGKLEFVGIDFDIKDKGKSIKGLKVLSISQYENILILIAELTEHNPLDIPRRGDIVDIKSCGEK